MLAHLRDGDTYARLAAGFAIGTTTAWRYVQESVDLLAALADDLDAATVRISRLACTILDGTLIPIDRIADQKPYYSGKHKCHGVKPRCCPRRTTAIVQAILVLQGIEEDRYSGLKGLSGMGCDRSKPSQNAQAARQ